MTKKLDLGRSTSWSLIWYGFKTGFRFLSNMILTRLLTPEMFGVAAIGNAFLNGMSMFSDIGLKQSVIRSPREDAAYYQTAWTIQLLRGLLLLIIMLALAAPIGYLYGSEQITTFLLIVAFSQLAMGFNNIEVLRGFKSAELRKVAILDIAAAIVGLGTMVAWALWQPSHVALAVGAVTSTASLSLLTLVFYSRSMCRIRFDQETVKDLLHFGKWVFISTMLAFFVMQLDRLALGKLATLELIGFYSIAWIWASIPNQVLGQWSGQVFFPLISETINRKGELNSIRMTRRAYVAVGVLVSSVIFAASDILVAVLYPPAYSDVAGLIRPMVGVALIATIEQSYSDILIAHGLPREKVIGQGLSIALFLALFWPVYQYGGLDWFIYLLGAVGVVRVIWFAYRLRRMFAPDLFADLTFFLAYVLCGQLLLQLNGLRIDHVYQLTMSLLQALAAGLASYWLYRRVNHWYSRDTTSAMADNVTGTAS